MGAPAILLEDSRPQAILKFHCPSSLDYRAHQGLGNIYRTLYTNLFRDALPGGGVIFFYPQQLISAFVSGSTHCPNHGVE